MPALFFPNLDALRLVLASGIVPPGVSAAPARAEYDSHGRLWLEPATVLPRDSLAGLARMGVQTLGSGGVLSKTVGCWAELLPLRAVKTQQCVGPNNDRFNHILFELPDKLLAGFLRSLRRRAKTPLGVRLFPASDTGHVWVTCPSPPYDVLLQCDEPASTIEPFFEQTPGIWVRVGWEHPFPDGLAVVDGRLLFLRPPRSLTSHPGPVPVPTLDEYPIAGRSSPPVPTAVPPQCPVRLMLQPDKQYARELVWVFDETTATLFWELCRSGDERLTRQFEMARTTDGTASRLIVRPIAGKKSLPGSFPLATPGYCPHPEVSNLFLPSGRVLRPAIRAKELASLFQVRPDRVTWVELGPGGEILPLSVSVTAFQPLSNEIDYVAPPPSLLPPGQARSELFALDRFVLHTTTEGQVQEPEVEEVAEFPDPRETLLTDYDPADRPGWLTRSLERIASRFRRHPETPRGLTPDGELDQPRQQPRRQSKQKTREPAPVSRVEEKLSSADALLHGRDRAARRHELESRLLEVFPLLGPDQRAAGWAELAAVYAATGNPNDAAICWINAAWEADPIPVGWLEQWYLAETRAAKQPAPSATLDRWLSEPGRFGAARVVAAYTAWAGHQTPPLPDLVSTLPRILAFLDQHFDDLPARAVWLARLAVTRLCEGDALGLARWRDRVLARLHDKGPGLDLDEPSFLRFHGTASPDRFQTAREWLTRARKPILDWIGRLAPTGRLQWAGLDSETECTAAYAQLMLAWGLGCLGERTRSRDWTARARKTLTRAVGPGVDPAVHELLSEAFGHRIRDAQEGRPAKPGFPAELLARFEQLPTFSRYAVDRLRDRSRILEPAGRSQAFSGLDLRGFRGYDLLGERLHVLANHVNPVQVADEARELLAMCDDEPTSSTVPRVALTLLELAPYLNGLVVKQLLAHVAPAVTWLETWLQNGRWSDAERTARLPNDLARLIGGAFAAAAYHNLYQDVRPVVDQLLRRAGGDAALRTAIGRSASSLFRSFRKLGYRTEAGALLQILDPSQGSWPAETTFPASRLGLAVGWFAAGNEDAGNRILDDARNRLFVARVGDDRERTELVIGYAEALGFAPPRIALGRLEQIFQLLDRVTVTGSTNRYFTLKPLQLVDSVVRSVVTEDFVLGPAVRGWLDDDEFLIRRRIHRDMATVLREEGIG